MKRNLKWICRFVPVLALMAGSKVCAQSYWMPASGGEWANARNWSAGVPDIHQAVQITNAGTKTVTINRATPGANLAARRMDLLAPPGATNTLRFEDLGGTPFRLANSLRLDAGGRVEIINSTISLDGTDGGSFNQFAGEVMLAGGGVFTTNGAELRIGRVGTGRTLITSGTVSAGSDLIVGGVAGSDGTLTLSNGWVSVGGELRVGDDPLSTGHVHVDGGTLMATNQAVTSRVGDGGEGTFTLTGGQVIMNGLSVGRAAGSSGRLNVRGGLLQPGSLSVGRFFGAQGTIEVTGGTLELSDNTLYIGREGGGTVIISGGTVHAETVHVAASDTASAVMQLHGGTLVTGRFIATNSAGQVEFRAGRLVTQASTVAHGAAFVVGDGVRSATLHLDGGTHAFDDGLVVSSNAGLTGTGTVVGTITVLPGGRNELGSPGPSVSLTVALVHGQLHLMFPGVAGRSYDILSTTNLAQPRWQSETTLFGNSDGLQLVYTNTAPDPQRFFRVRGF